MPLNYDELRAFIDTITVPEYRLMVAIIVSAGLRAGEVRNMLKSDVSGPHILVRKTKCRTDKNGRKIKPYREIPKPAWVQEIIHETLTIIERLERYPRFGPENFLFQRERGGGQLTVGGINDRLARIFANVDTPQKITCHSLRKTAAVKLDESCGHDLSITQRFFDHKSIATTGIYINKGRTAFEDAYKAAFE